MKSSTIMTNDISLEDEGQDIRRALAFGAFGFALIGISFGV